MKAVVLHEYGGPEKLKWEEMPDPVAGKGEVLVRVSASSVNPVDYKMRSGAAKAMFPVEFPGILGRDVSGIVRAVGDGVTGFAPGDRVFALANHTYAELCVVKATELAKIPEGMDVANAAALPLVLQTGDQMVRYGTKIEKGQTILVAGALGSVGRTAVFVARQAGCTVFAGVRKSQIAEAQALQADDVIALDDEKAMAGLGLLDGIADAVGGATGEALLGKIKPGGIFGTVVSVPANAARHPTVTVNRITCKPEPKRLVELALEVQAGRLVIPIGRVMSLADAGAAQAAAEKGGNGKILLTA